MAFNEKEAAKKVLVAMGFEPEIVERINTDCDLTVAVFARNGQHTINSNKLLMAAAAEMRLGYRAVSGDGLFLFLPKAKAGVVDNEMEKLKRERDALQARLAAMEAKMAPAAPPAPPAQEVVVPAVAPNRNVRRRPAPPPLDNHFGD